MNRIDYGEELAAQKRRARNYRQAGRIWPDGSIQSADPQVRYTAGRVAINQSELEAAREAGWKQCADQSLALQGMVVVERP